MGIHSYINSKTLNTKLSDVLNKYDTDQNGFTQKEFSSAIKGMTTIFARNIIKLTGYDKKFFRKLDVNQDTIVSYQELAEYVKNEYNLDFYSWMDLQISAVCKEIEQCDDIKESK